MSPGRAAAYFAIFGALVGGGCQLIACVPTDIVVTGGTGGSSEPCSSEGECDDMNPCTDDVCASGACDHINNSYLPDDNNECTDDACKDGKVFNDPSAMGKKCGPNGALTCDDKGQCIQCVVDNECTTGLSPSCDVTSHACVSCDDGKQDGDETGVDCGGSKCAPCRGEACSMANPPCVAGLPCVDGVCCDTMCSGPCQACNLPGKAGTCSGTLGSVDPTCPSPKQTCDGTAGGTTACKAGLMQACATSNDCFNGACWAGLCRRMVGDMCTDSAECGTNRCNNGACQACSVNGDCLTSTCMAPVCKGKWGAPCASNNECNNGKCTAGLCLNEVADMCTAGNQCVTGLCSGNKCVTCVANGDCMGFNPGNPQCGTLMGVGGICQAAKGAYCSVKYQCTSGVCSGFPLKCQ